jgi:hypothetical protein
MQILRFSSTVRNGLLMPSLILLAILFSPGCGKDKLPSPEIPPAEVETSALAFNSPIGVELIGKIINPGGGNITDHGFIYWFNVEDEISKGTRVSLGGEIASGFFTATINGLKFPQVNGLQALFVAKAYVTDKHGTRYGDIFSGRYKNSVISSIFPNEGKTGDVIALAGDYKGLKASDINISFGGIQSALKTITDIGVTVEVPTGIPVGHGQTVEVTSTVGVVTSYLSYEFRIWANIKDMNPKFGPINTKIRFTGDNLPASKNAMYVYFGQPDVPGNSDYDNGFYVGVPGRIRDEKMTLSYTKGNIRVLLPWEFTLTPPVIKSIGPNPALDLQTVAIQLENFLFLQNGDNEFSVKVGNFPQWVNADEDGKLIFRLDRNARYATGHSYPVSITFGPNTVNSSIALTIAKPEATGFSPKAGLPGIPIHITGKFAKGAGYFVRFNSNGGVSFDAVSDSEIVGRLPMGMEAKTYTLSVTSDAGDIPVPGGVFQVLPTKFEAVSPLSATAGSTIAITGEGFVSNGGTITANFAGHIAHVNSVTSNKITLVIGNSTPPGTYRIKLDWDNRIYDTGQSITVVL